MNKKNIKPLVLSSLAALSLGSMSVAGTFALFTDQAETTISIGAAEVSVKNAMTIEGAYSLNGAEIGTAVAEGKKSATYVNGGQATVKDVNGETTEVKIEKWTPGDGVKLRSAPDNGSNVTIKVRLKVVISGELAPALVMKVMKAGESDVVCAATGERTLVTDWAPVAPNTNPTAFDLEIAFPDHDNGEIKFGEENKDNQYQDKAATIKVSYEAVQGNADVSANLLERINTKLATEEVLDGSKNANMFEAVNDLAGVATLAQIKANNYVWGADEDLFYETVGIAAGEEYKYFKVYEAANVPAKADQTFSIYADGSGWTSLELKGVGFDAGSVEGMTAVSYEGAASARENIIRTNGGTLTVNAPLDTIRHYGNAAGVNIVAVAGSSYHENGTVQLIAVKQGHVKLEGEADVNGIYVYNESTAEQKDTSFEEIKITVDNGVDIPKLSRSAVEVQPEGTKVCTVVTDQAKDIYLFNEGIYEQIKTVDAGKNVATDTSAAWADNSAKNTENTQTAAMQLANEFNGSYDTETGKIADKEVTVGETEYTVKFNEETRTFETYQGEEKVTDTTVVETVAKEADVASDSGKTADEAKFIATAFASGSGTENDPFLIATTEQWMNISYIYKKAGETVYYKVIADLNYANQDPYVDTYEYQGKTYENRYYCYLDDVTQDIHLDLNNHTLSNVDYPLFDTIYHLDIHNGKVGYTGHYGAITDGVGSNDVTSLYVHDITLFGTIDTKYSHFGPVVSYCYGKNKNNCTVTLENIDNQLKITNAATSSYTGGFIGYIQGSKASLIVKNCTFSGSIQGMYVGGFVGECSAPNGSVLVSEGNIVSGSLLGSTSAKAFGISGNYNKSTPASVESSVTVSNTATIRTISPDATLVSTSIGYGEEFVINHTNSNVAYYTATLSFNIDVADGSSGGYPRDIMFTIETDGASSYNTGLFKCYIESSATNNSTPENLVLNQSGVVVWKVGDTYYVYSDAYKLSTNGKAYLYIYGYDVDGGLVTYINASYTSVHN